MTRGLLPICHSRRIPVDRSSVNGLPTIVTCPFRSQPFGQAVPRPVGWSIPARRQERGVSEQGLQATNRICGGAYLWCMFELTGAPKTNFIVSALSLDSSRRQRAADKYLLPAYLRIPLESQSMRLVRSPASSHAEPCIDLLSAAATGALLLLSFVSTTKTVLGCRRRRRHHRSSAISRWRWRYRRTHECHPIVIVGRLPLPTGLAKS